MSELRPEIFAAESLCGGHALGGYSLAKRYFGQKRSIVLKGVATSRKLTYQKENGITMSSTKASATPIAIIITVSATD